MISLPRLMIYTAHGRKITDQAMSWSIWTVIAVVLFIVAITKGLFLPKNFFFDASTIEWYIEAHATLIPGDSYASTAAIYRMLGFRQSSSSLPVIASMIVIPMMFWGLSGAYFSAIRIRHVVAFVFFGFLSVVYMTMLSKDLLVVFLVIGFILRPKNYVFLGMAAWIFLAMLYAYFFRTYWFLCVAIFLILRILFSHVKNPYMLLPAIFALLLIIAVFFGIKLGVSVDSFRVIVNETRLDNGDMYAKTMIMPFIPGGTFVGGYVNICLTLFSLIVPLPMLAILTPYYVTLVILIAGTQLGFWRAAAAVIRNGTDARVLEYVCLVVSFMAVQSMFEPDYGSYVRHLSPFYPMILFTWLRMTTSSSEMSVKKRLWSI